MWYHVAFWTNQYPNARIVVWGYSEETKDEVMALLKQEYPNHRIEDIISLTPEVKLMFDRLVKNRGVIMEYPYQKYVIRETDNYGISHISSDISQDMYFSLKECQIIEPDWIDHKSNIRYYRLTKRYN